MTIFRVAFPALVCLMVFTSSIVAVQQSWGDFAMPQRQTDVAKTGLQAGDFGAFTDGIVKETVITLQNLSSVPYNKVSLGPSDTCPENITLSSYYGRGLVQDDDLNLYATFVVAQFGPPQTWTIKLSRGVDDDFIPQWVTCTSNSNTIGQFNNNPALYMDAANDTFVILRDIVYFQVALRTSDGLLEHKMRNDDGFSQVGDVAVTPDGVVLQPGSLIDLFIASTEEPLSGTNFTFTTQGDTTNQNSEVLRTIGSPNSFIGYTPQDVAFFDNLGQSGATTLLNASLGQILKVTGLKDGRVVVLHRNITEATLTIVDYDGTNRVDIVFSNQYIYPGSTSGGYPDPEPVCEGADGHVYVLDADCNLYRVDIANLSTEKINYTGNGDCGNGEEYLTSNDEGVFFLTSGTGNKRGANPYAGNVVEFVGLQYGNSAIEQLGNDFTIQNGPRFTSGYTVPGAQVALLGADSINLTVPEPIIVIAAFNLPEEASSESDSEEDAASSLSPIFPSEWASWLF